MESNVSRQAKPFKVVVGIDFSPPSKGVLLRALELANREEGAEVHVVTVADYDRTALGIGAMAAETPSDAVVRLKDFASSALGEFNPSGAPVKLGRVVTHLLLGPPAHEIVWLAAHLDADLVVVGTHGRRGVSRLFLGSVAERVVRMAGCPVFVVRDKQHESTWRVPEIEPPCPDCLAVRSSSNGERLWCQRHETHVHTHVYSAADSSNFSFRPWGFSS